MMFFLYGDDSYRSWQKLADLKAKYLSASAGDTDLAVLEGASLKTADFISQTRLQPFLAKHRLVIVKNLLREGTASVQEGVMEALDDLPDSTILVFYESGSPDRRTKIFKRLNLPKTSQFFPALSGAPLINYALAEAEKLNLALGPAGAKRLTDLTGPDLWRLNHELQKLSLYKPAKSAVTGQDIELLVGGQPELKVFDLTDALGERRPALALKLLDQVSANESSLGLLALIAGHFRNLLLISAGTRDGLDKSQLALRLAIHPFAFDKCFHQSPNYSYDELRACYRYLLHLDLSAKLSIVDPLIALAVLAGSLEARPLRLPPLTEEAILLAVN